MVRFKDGQPTAVWFSQHEYGEAYSYSAVQKVGKRPVAYSAKGSHANYAKAASLDLHNFSKCNSILPTWYLLKSNTTFR